MRISFEIERDEAIVALMYYVGLGIVIKTKKDFRRELTNYFRQNGTQCQDDHEYENEPSRSKAIELVDKYFN